jgi:hypothetical protein
MPPRIDAARAEMTTRLSALAEDVNRNHSGDTGVGSSIIADMNEAVADLRTHNQARQQ